MYLINPLFSAARGSSEGTSYTVVVMDILHMAGHAIGDATHTHTHTHAHTDTHTHTRTHIQTHTLLLSHVVSQHTNDFTWFIVLVNLLFLSLVSLHCVPFYLSTSLSLSLFLSLSLSLSLWLSPSPSPSLPCPL